MSPKFIPLGMKLKFELYKNNREDDKYYGDVHTSDVKSDDLFNFVFTEHRSWDTRKRLYGVRNGNGVYLLSVEGIFDGEKIDIDYGKMIDEGCIDFPPKYFSMVNESKSFTHHKVKENCSITNFAGLKTVVTQTYSESENTKTINLTITKGLSSYNSIIIMNESGIITLKEQGDHTAKRISSVNLLITASQKPYFIEYAEMTAQ
jgi:hypothetical protein